MNSIINAVKEHKPLIHCITNPISINQCANAILAVGGTPIMAEHPEEVGEITDSASALVLNLGNITDIRIESMLVSALRAKEKNIPIVVDLVGIACSRLRRNFAHRLVQNSTPAVIKGNYSEINALYNCGYFSSGVDADKTLDVHNTGKIAARLAQKYNCIILASGATDIVTDGKQLLYITNGTPQLSAVTGTGCMLGALCGCYMSVCSDIRGAVTACVVLGACGELAATDKGNGTFMVNLMDNLSVVTDKDIEKYMKAEEKNIESV